MSGVYNSSGSRTSSPPNMPVQSSPQEGPSPNTRSITPSSTSQTPATHYSLLAAKTTEYTDATDPQVAQPDHPLKQPTYRRPLLASPGGLPPAPPAPPGPLHPPGRPGGRGLPPRCRAPQVLSRGGGEEEEGGGRRSSMWNTPGQGAWWPGYCVWSRVRTC